jgi:nucleotide-binding universal stress UspA family protein
MIKQLVVGIDGSDYGSTALEYALYLAGKSVGEIKVVFAVDSRKTDLPIIYATGHFDYAFARTYIPPDSELKAFYQKLKKDIATFADSCLDACRSRCESEKIPFVAVQREGLPSVILAEESRSGDLLIIGQKGENARFDRTIVGSTTEDVVRSSPRPVLVCPRDFREPRRLLFPYDCSQQAERALLFSVNALGEFWQEFVILLAGVSTADEAGAGSAAEASRGRLIEKEERYLKKHGITPRVVYAGGTPVETVLAVAQQEDSDLILVGSHGKHMIKDYILGSTTSHLIRKSQLPVLVIY